MLTIKSKEASFESERKLMRILEAQLASATTLLVHGDFESDAPGKLAGMQGLSAAYLVPQLREGRRCLVVNPKKPVTARHARNTVRLVEAIARCLWEAQPEVKLVCAVERRNAGQPAQTLTDWVRLR